MQFAAEPTLKRPYPPAMLGEEDVFGSFVRAPEVEDWLLDTFVDLSSPLYHEEHEHLEEARIGVLWTNTVNKRRGTRVSGTAQIPRPHPALSGWDKELFRWMLRHFFGAEEPDFLITLDASYCATCSDVNFCALGKHELLHCAQAVDEFGGKRYRKKDNSPVFTIVGHDAETFVSVARDFGPVDRGVADLYEALKLPPRIAQADIDWVCGTRMQRAA